LNRRQTRHRTEVTNASNKSEELRPWLALEEQQKLFSQCPLFFRSVRYPGVYPSNLAFSGIQCGLGWYPIIAAVAREIECLIFAIWYEQLSDPENIASVEHNLRAGILPQDVFSFPLLPFCTEIRETGGQLQISMASGYLCDGAMWTSILDTVQCAKWLAQDTCERCGRPGVIRRGYWEHVYGDECVAPRSMPE
jgi:hypothetical protein